MMLMEVYEDPMIVVVQLFTGWILKVRVRVMELRHCVELSQQHNYRQQQS
jgi:hypothetical protein